MRGVCLTRQQRNGAMILLVANSILKGPVLNVNERRPFLRGNQGREEGRRSGGRGVDSELARNMAPPTLS